MKIYQSAIELIGGTPLLHAANLQQAWQTRAGIYTKLEYLNPAGSVKDRVAKAMIEDAEQAGTLQPGGVIIEPTSGNTGIGLAAVAAIKGYKAVIVMPDTMSVERRNIIKAYGAQIVLTDGARGMQGAIEKARQLHAETPNSIIAGQFVNPANPAAHRETTAPEIWEALQGNADIFVAGVGTGGTVTGIGEYLKARNPHIKVVAVEPKTSPVLSQGRAGKHGIQGIGAGFVPEILNTDIFDEIIAVEDTAAIEQAKLFAKTEGILTGISSGAALAAAKELAEREENSGKNIVVLLPDSADRYFSTPLFQE